MSPLGAEFRTLLAAARRLDSDPISTQGPGLFAWGLNSSGQLGLGHTANRSSPVQVGALTTWTAVAKPETHEDALLVPFFKERVRLFTPVPTSCASCSGNAVQIAVFRLEKNMVGC